MYRRLALAGRWCIVGVMSVDAVQVEAEDNQKRTLIDALYRKYSLALRKFLVRRHVNQADVADIVQETYCRVLNSGEVESVSPLHRKPFLFQGGEQRRAQRGEASPRRLRKGTSRWILMVSRSATKAQVCIGDSRQNHRSWR